MDELGFILPPEHWDPLNLVYFFEPNSYTVLNSRRSIRVCDVLPETSSNDKFASVIKNYVQSAHQRQYKGSGCSSELPDPMFDFDIFVLPDQVRDCILMSQHPNHFFYETGSLIFFILLPISLKMKMKM